MMAVVSRFCVWVGLEMGDGMCWFYEEVPMVFAVSGGLGFNKVERFIGGVPSGLGPTRVARGVSWHEVSLFFSIVTDIAP